MNDRIVAKARIGCAKTALELLARLKAQSHKLGISKIDLTRYQERLERKYTELAKELK